MATFSGNPLTGSLEGTSEGDIYSGTGLHFGLSALELIDSAGDDQIVAVSMSPNPGAGAYVTSAIHQSDLRLGDGFITLNASVNHGYYASGVSGGSLTMGAGDSTLIVEAVEHSARSFVYQVSGITDWTLDAGAGNDSLAIMVRGSRSETFADYGVLSSTLAFGDGADTLAIDIASNSGAPTSKAISGSSIDLGADDDRVEIASTGYGITETSLDAGSGADLLSVVSTLDAIASGSILMGSGNDGVTLDAGNPNSAELVDSAIDLGDGDDFIRSGRAVNATILGGDGNDTLVLLGALDDYQFDILEDRTIITRADDLHFGLSVQGVENFIAEGVVQQRTFTAERLTGFLSDPDGADTAYSGTGLSAAIENLSVIDLAGNDTVRAINATETGGVSSYISSGIAHSDFLFGDGSITFQVKINQGYYAAGIRGGSLSMGDGSSFIDIQAVEDFPADRLGFYYGVTGISGWQLDAGGGDDVLNVVVRGHKAETFHSNGIQGGTYALGDGDDIVNISIVNESGTGEAVALEGVSALNLGRGDDSLKILSTGTGVRGSVIDTGTGNDLIDIAANRDVIQSSQVTMGDGYDSLFLKCNGGNSADFFNSSVDLGGGDDYAELAFAVNSTIDGGNGHDILRLRGEEGAYVLAQNAEGDYLITRTDNALFSLTARNFESIIYGGVAATPFYTGTPLTGYLTGTDRGDDSYVGSGLSTAIENLTVIDGVGFNRVLATNLSASGGIESYASYGIANSDFTFGGNGLEFVARINQGYYAYAVAGGSLTASMAGDRITISATETNPSNTYGFYYAVTGAADWMLDTRGGNDSFDLRVYAHRYADLPGHFVSYGINGGRYDFGDGDDTVSISITNASGSTESVAINNTQGFDLGTGDDTLTVMSTGLGGRGNLTAGDGHDFIAVESVLSAWSEGILDLGTGNDRIALRSGRSDHAAIKDVLVDLGLGDDVARVESYDNSTISGGEGHDTVVLGGAAADHRIAVQADGSMIVTRLAAPEQTLILLDVENIQFESGGERAIFAIEGKLSVGSTLSVTTVSIDARGMASAHYACIWQASGDGVTWHDVGADSTLLIGGHLQGQQIRVEVSYFDQTGTLHRSLAQGGTPVMPPSEIPGTTLDPSVDPNTSVYTMDSDATEADLTGTSYAALVGNAGGNVIQANALGNYLDGGTGDDQLNGGVSDDVLAGGDGDDTVNGGDGDDLIVGGGGAGDDQYIGGAGIDTVRYTSAVTGIVVDLAASTARGNEIGNDRLFQIENIIGGQANDFIRGSSGANRLEGYTGADTLDGGGGLDTLIGGAGNDTYITDGGDTITENADEGIDTVKSSVSLALGANLENLVLTGIAAIKGTGNALANRLTGNAGNNTLNGGLGNDTLIGGAGNDTYNVNAAGDRVFETTTTASTVDAGGIDTVQSAVSFSLDANAGVRFVERLTLTGTGNINGTGNGLANVLTGNAGNNVLNGGLGNDTLIGGAGNDTYVVDAAGDRVFETTTTASTVDAGGIDTVQSGVSFSLDANAGVRFVERLTLTGTGSINGTGNALANVLTGNAGNNVLKGGLGNDTLIGGAGNDTFVFNTSLGAENIDRINDFNVADDTIRLDDLVFAGLATKTLAASAFAANLTGTATDALDRIIYETDTGRLYFDADGNGGGARVLFATMASNLALTHADFFVF